MSAARGFAAVESDGWIYCVLTDGVDSAWDVYYVLLIVTDGDGTCGRRGLGEVFRDAFKKSHEPGYADTRGVRSCWVESRLSRKYPQDLTSVNGRHV